MMKILVLDDYRDNLKTALMHNISHEVRTPLNGILGFGELLASNDLTGDKREMYYRILKESSERLVRTINDYVDISLIVSGTMEVTKSMYSIRNIMDELLQTFQPRCDAKKLTLNMVYPDLTSRKTSSPIIPFC
jgi:signal transduction histidine kinase